MGKRMAMVRGWKTTKFFQEPKIQNHAAIQYAIAIANNQSTSLGKTRLINAQGYVLFVELSARQRVTFARTSTNLPADEVETRK